jgi:hypothetical protein
MSLSCATGDKLLDIVPDEVPRRFQNRVISIFRPFTGNDSDRAGVPE